MTSSAPRPPQAQLLEQLIAGQAKADERFEELFRRLNRAEETAGEARDTAREVVIILREQDTGARITEVRSELRSGVAEIRQDMVHANSRLRVDLEAEATDRIAADLILEKRIDALEAERNKVVGVASFFSWLSRVAPWLVAVGAAVFATVEAKSGG